MYVNDIIERGLTVDRAKQLKDTSVDVFRHTKIEIYKWFSNQSVLENLSKESKDQMYAKQQLSVNANE